MIKRQSITVDCPAATPEEAIRKAGNALCRAGACSPQYVQAMIASYRELGPYFVIAPGLALPHARPEQGAIKAQISAIRLREPLAFGHAENDPVRVVLGLSATSSDAHIHLIQHIVTVLSDENNLHTLMHSDNPEQLYRLLASGSQRL
ncbi:phosphoenolpyruvate-dependent sugar phosphotransferase system, EIIA 2 family protein [Klebsiella oxytoca]|uniref:Ascorbate-specific phosphotransferase enzyme IIA component n=1 Tax=Klebsiella oxytoca TaxID=571 RepID=A0A6N3B2J5_KLEOX|nr:PTS sugar transporter subunit IIA [Klebsiella oxytoca]AWF37789.1 phosphoenolpyruvate-dependent sugar phosphotransferase system, EIIA 2 family protein [Klebsiella oxytoca]STR22414.1 PTS system ascorbate-specific transporter [Klebsiella oxytoca]HCK0928930.1 PTS sugar transporter subunit IIA [Klebsiella oxytoca]HEJ7642744.1 PTS sugar transporter subunit IIA [Klebsiella oxytoca]